MRFSPALLLVLALAWGCQASPTPVSPEAAGTGGEAVARPRDATAQSEPSGESSSTLAAKPDAAGGDGAAEDGALGDTDESGDEADDGDTGDEFEDEMTAELDDEFAARETEELYDPLSGYNRFMTDVNDGLYTYVMAPAARGYRFVLPEYVRLGIGNFFDNLLYPVRAVNNLLQGKIANTGEETLRFTVNTTVGILGLWDPADIWFGLEEHDEDFGQTLGVWGVGPGPHIVLPFFGPSNMRDMFGMVPDHFLDPVTYIEDPDTELGIRTLRELNYVSLHLGEYENLKRDAIDLYPFLREIYEQNRAKEILE